MEAPDIAAAPPPAGPETPGPAAAPRRPLLVRLGAARDTWWGIALVLMVLTCAQYLIGHVMSLGEIESLMYAKQFLDPTYMPDDWYLNLEQLVRRPFHYLMAPFVLYLPLPLAAVFGRLLAWSISISALALIARHLKLDAIATCAAVSLYFLTEQTASPMGEWVIDRVEAKAFAYGIVFWGLYALLRRKLWIAAACAGLATTMHVFVGGWSTLALVGAALLTRTGGLRDWIKAAVAWLVAGAPALYFVLDHTRQPGITSSLDADYIYLVFRNPHNYDTTFWHWHSWHIVLVAVLPAACVSAGLWLRDRSAQVVGLFAVLTFVPFLIGLAMEESPLAMKVWKTSPFRVGSTILPLFGLLLCARVLGAAMPRLLSMLLFLTIACSGFWLAGLEFQKDYGRLTAHPEGGYWESDERTDALHHVCEWIAANTEPGCKILASPHMDAVGYLSNRPVVVRFRCVPSSDADIIEWWHRLVDLSGGREPQEQGFKASYEIDVRFRELSATMYTELGRKYGCRYVLTRQKRDDLEKDLPRLFSNKYFLVFRLPE